VRGRWAAKTSVLRYAKTAFSIEAVANTPSHVEELGRRIVDALGERAVVPVI
jgi:hypothetical protein